MSGSVNICAVTEEVKKALKDFRFRKAQDTAALILKVDREKQQIIIDENLEDIAVEDLQETLPSHQPRYIILSYRQEHKDGRISYPLCFIFFTPRDSHAELQMMYAGSKIALQQEAELTRSYEIRELEDLTEEWLLEKLDRINRDITFILNLNLRRQIYFPLLEDAGEKYMLSVYKEVITKTETGQPIVKRKYHSS